MQQEFKKVLKGSIHQMKHFQFDKKDLEIFRKFRSESLKILKRGTGRTLIIEQNDKKRKTSFEKIFKSVTDKWKKIPSIFRKQKKIENRDFQ